MRILRVAQKVYPDVKGGGPYHVHAMSRDQAAMGHDVTVLTIQREPDALQCEDREGYTVLRKPPTVSPLGNDISVGMAGELWNATDFDVIHAHSHLYFATNLAALRRQFGETPLGITNHGLRSQTATGRAFECYLRTIGRLTLDAADIVFTYTDAERSALRGLGVGTDVTIVPNGINIDWFAPEGEARDMPGEGPSVLFVGRLVDGKRPGHALEAIARVREDVPDVSFLLAGEGPLQEDLQQRAADLGLSESVYFLGHVPYGQMPALYRGAGLLVLPSETEGVPRTVLEALATETPVVSTKLTQLEELLERGGVGVPIGDVDDLADVIRRLLADPSRRNRLGEAGRAYVVKEHNWSDTVRRTTERLSRLKRHR